MIAANNSIQTKRVLQFVLWSMVGIIGSFAVLNILLLGFFKIKDSFSPYPDMIAARFGDSDIVLQVYPDMSREEVNIVLYETWSYSYVFDSYAFFREEPRNGVYVNVSEDGFRIVDNQGVWPPDENAYNVFVFGSSTAFGYGVPDNQTIASHLQAELRSELPDMDVRVYNFGRGYYFSSQERILFEGLVGAGFIPDMAIFIDGFNDITKDGEEPSPQAVSSAEEHSRNKSLLDFLHDLPLLRAVRGIISILPQRQPVDGTANSTPEISASSTPSIEEYRQVVTAILNQELETEDVPESYVRYANEAAKITYLVDRYISNKTAIETIAEDAGVQAVFVWQPVSTYGYDLSYHLFPPSENSDAYRRIPIVYPMMQVQARDLGWGDSFIWCADVQAGLQAPLYVDQYHYTGELSAMLAQCIAEAIISRELLWQ